MGIDVINSIFSEEAGDEYIEPALYYIGKSIDLIGKVNAVYFMEGWQLSRGCVIERKVCETYGIKILDTDFLEVNPGRCQIKRI